MERAGKPDWLKVPLGGGEAAGRVRARLRRLGLHTVCQEARCPNLADCFGRGTATLLLLGDRCTRDCRFCAVAHGTPAPPDPDEPRRAAEAVAALGLRYAVLTSVTRDDLPDGGAGTFARAVRAIRERSPATRVEVLVPDLGGDESAVAAVLAERPAVFGHNVETTRRLTAAVRDRRCDYDRSLGVLAAARRLGGAGLRVKSALMLGLGESDAEARQAMGEVREAGADLLALGQYLRPSAAHAAVCEYVTPERFADLRRHGEGVLGFAAVAAGPLVRSSYRADELDRAGG